MADNALRNRKSFMAALINALDLLPETPDREAVAKTANALTAIVPYDGDIESCIEEALTAVTTNMSTGVSLIDNEDPHNRDWVDERNDIEWVYSNAYEDYLRSDGWSPKVVETLNNVGKNILSYLRNPKDPDRWDRRGLVIGHVQSGKTANYLDVIAKAADAGYKFIIVIAGIHNNLRRQTQQRIERGFVGRSSESEGNKRKIGVGLKNRDFPHPVTITTVDKDFNKNSARDSNWQLDDFISKPVIFIIKKNVSTLSSLHKWLSDLNADGNNRITDVPMLMIDDEADNASINTNKAEIDPTRTNELIRKILALFDKSSFVGYTATPFANIFINPEGYTEACEKELFPEDFIYSLDAPTNYFGPQKVFIDEDKSRSIVREITDCENYIPFRHKKDDDIVDLPPSLYNAIHQFIITRAIRNLRGQENQHHSMMVNVSRFINIQTDISGIIRWHVRKLDEAVQANSGMPDNANKHMGDLKRCLDLEFADCGANWEDVKKALPSVFEHLKIFEVNSRSDEKLDYEKYEADGIGLTALAIGGLSLSRGLTIEGLCISYMYRNTKMYDTLMQMGRWFGYRPEYEDLCRVHLSPDSIDWYGHIAEATDELKQQIRIMRREGATPRDFGLYVQSHPDRLLITAPGKMRAGQQITSRDNLSLRIREVSILPTDEQINAGNEDLIKKYWQDGFGGCPVKQVKKRGWYILDAPIEEVYQFMEKFQTHPAYSFIKRSLLDFIDQIREDHSHADVFLRSVSDEGAGENVEKFMLGVQKRETKSKTWFRPENGDYWKNRKSRVGSPNDENIGLTEKQIEDAKELVKEGTAFEVEEGKEMKEVSWRCIRGKPLLMIHVMKFHDSDQRVPTFGISFPSGNYDKRIDIIANPQFIKMMLGDPDDLADDDEDYDD